MRLSICGLKTEQSEYAIYVFVTSVCLCVCSLLYDSQQNRDVVTLCVSVSHVGTKKSQNPACEKH